MKCQKKEHNKMKRIENKLICGAQAHYCNVEGLYPCDYQGQIWFFQLKEDEKNGALDLWI